MTAFLGLLAIIFGILLVLAVTYYLQAKSDLKNARQECVNVKQKAQRALARYKSISDLETYKTQLATSVAKLKQVDAEWRERISAHESSLSNLIAQSEAVEEALEMQSFGFYRPKYGFEDSERYSYQLEVIRNQQKAMIKEQTATHCPQQWTVDGSAAKGRKMVKEHAKLMLRAFNGECDAAVGKVKYNNVNNLEARINRSLEAINKLGESKQLWITREYLNLKLQELYLVHEHREKVHEEREEQRRIKEEMREEEKAQKEIEKAQREAERDETTKTKALEKAKQELAEAHGIQTERLQSIVDKLESELKDALERKAKAIARAQLTRSGHIYVLSNIGTFGEGVYKIGMTRRFEPLERVRELGDASVPFPFDVHAMIYTEDAPELEKVLHRHFESRRVNMVNQRREYFRVSLAEIHKAVAEHFREITFVKTPEAEEYRKTLAIQKETINADHGGNGRAVGSQP